MRFLFARVIRERFLAASSLSLSGLGTNIFICTEDEKRVRTMSIEHANMPYSAEKQNLNYTHCELSLQMRLSGRRYPTGKFPVLQFLLLYSMTNISLCFKYLQSVDCYFFFLTSFLKTKEDHRKCRTHRYRKKTDHHEWRQQSKI